MSHVAGSFGSSFDLGSSSLDGGEQRPVPMRPDDPEILDKLRNMNRERVRRGPSGPQVTIMPPRAQQDGDQYGHDFYDAMGAPGMTASGLQSFQPLQRQYTQPGTPPASQPQQQPQRTLRMPQSPPNVLVRMADRMFPARPNEDNGKSFWQRRSFQDALLVASFTIIALYLLLKIFRGSPSASQVPHTINIVTPANGAPSVTPGFI